MKIALIYSDTETPSDVPSVRDVCLNDVHDALKSLGHDVVTVPAKDGIFKRLKAMKPEIDLAFNLADWGYGFNTHMEPHIPAMLDILGIPYTGSDFICLANCLDKVMTKQLLISNDLPTPHYEQFRKKISRKTDLPDLSFPLIVKPSKEDGSTGLEPDSVVDDSVALVKRVNETIAVYDQPALVEEFIEGREINVGLLGWDKLMVLPLSEIMFSLHLDRNFLPADAKWDSDSPYFMETIPKCPAELDGGLKKTLEGMAEKAYRLLKVKDYGRVDFRVSEEGQPYILEVNPNPDLSKSAGLARMAKANGLDYCDMISSVIGNAAKRSVL